MEIVKEVGRKKQTYYSYACPNHQKNICKTKAINADYIENYVIDIVLKIINNSSLDDNFKSILKETTTFTKSMLTKNQNALVNSHKLLDKYISNLDSFNNSEPIKKQCEKRINEISLDIERYENEISSYQESLNDINNFNDFNLTKKEILSNRIVARNLIKLVIKEIIYDEETNDIQIELI